jgi:hypothetical protein
MGLSGLFYPWGFILQALAILHFVRRRPETYWLWIILIGGALGAFVYIVAEVVPDASLLRSAYDGMGRRRRIRDLEAAVLDNPSVGNLEELADQYLDDGRFARARELYDKVIGSGRANSLDPYYRRGLAEIQLEDFPAALAELDKVVSQDRKYDFHRAIGLLAHAHARAGDPDAADALFKDATAISTLSETYYNYATFLTSRQRTAEARQWAERILAKKPTMPRYLRRRERPWFRKATALLKQLPSQVNP